MKNFTDFILFFSKKSKREIVHIPISVNQKIYFLLIMLILLFTVPGKAVDSPFNFEFAVNKISYLNNITPPSPHGLITVSFTPGEDGKYLSVLAENNAENISGFIVKNLFLPSIAEEDSNAQISTTFLLSQVSVSLKLPIKLTLTAYITDFPDYFPFQVDSIAEITTVDVTEIIYNIGDIEVPQMEASNVPVNEVVQPAGDTLKFAKHRDNVDNIDLDSSAHPPTITYAGDSKACAPASAANSIKWLEKTYPNVKLPPDMTLRKTLEKLSSRMGRSPGKGPQAEDMIKGKLDFMVEFNLPVDVKFQCEGVEGDITGFFGDVAKNLNKQGEKPSWDFLKQMIQEGEDVEINYAWIDINTGKFDSVGHSVVITGVQEFTSGKKEFLYKHDANQKCPNGLREELQPVTTDSAGWTRFGFNGIYYIYCIIAESPVRSSSSTTSVELTSAAPLRFQLGQNYPNPFNPETNFEFWIASASGGEFVSLKIYDVLGNEISILVNEEKPAGEYTIRFDASSLASGVYYYTLKAGSFVETKKMIVLK